MGIFSHIISIMANGTSEKNIDIDGVKAKTAEKPDASQSPKGPSREYYYPYNKIHKDTTEPSEVPNNTDSKTTHGADVTSKYSIYVSLPRRCLDLKSIFQARST